MIYTPYDIPAEDRDMFLANVTFTWVTWNPVPD